MTDSAIPRDISSPPIRDFSSKKPPYVFTMDGDTFTAARDLPAVVIKKLVTFQDKTMPEQVAVVMDMLDMILIEESAQRFATRMSSADNPISVSQIIELMNDLLEVYGLRPTTPLSTSAPPLTPTGDISMDGAQPMVSIPI
jgi:hypothetical protein